MRMVRCSVPAMFPFRFESSARTPSPLLYPCSPHSVSRMGMFLPGLCLASNSRVFMT